MAKPPQAGAPAPVFVIRKKVYEAGHHGGAWKVAYADFVTAMMAFFLLLWLLSSPDKDRLRGIARYFSPVPPAAEAGAGTGKQLSEMQARMEADRASALRRANASNVNARSLESDLRATLLALPATRGASDNIAVHPSRDGARIELMDTAARPLFRIGTAEPNEYGRAIFMAVGERLGARGARIALEGHSDGTGGLSAPNWQLSAGRAEAVRLILVGAGVAPDRIAEVTALAATRLAFPDAPTRPENRRVTLVVLDEDGPLPLDGGRP